MYWIDPDRIVSKVSELDRVMAAKNRKYRSSDRNRTFQGGSNVSKNRYFSPKIDPYRYPKKSILPITNNNARVLKWKKIKAGVLPGLSVSLVSVVST